MYFIFKDTEITLANVIFLICFFFIRAYEKFICLLLIINQNFSTQLGVYVVPFKTNIMLNYK